jgi:hypothetical protein
VAFQIEPWEHRHAILLEAVVKATWADALPAGFVAMAAGAIMPNVANSISSIFSKAGSVVDEASETGGS